MQHRKFNLFLYILFLIFIYIIGFVTSQIINNGKKTSFRKSKVSNNAITDNTDLNCNFYSYDNLISLLISYNYTKDDALDFVDYILKRAKKSFFLNPEIKKYLIDNNFTFALPNDINDKWLGRFYINNESNITAFPPIVYQKNIIYHESAYNYTKVTYYFLSRNEFIDHCVYSGMTSKAAINFEKNLFSTQFVKTDSTLPEDIKNTMRKMNYDYSVLTTDSGFWSGIINIRHGNDICTFFSSDISKITNYFNIKNDVPIYVKEANETVIYTLYDDNWKIFISVFFGLATPFSIRNIIYHPDDNNYFEINYNLSDNVKQAMSKGNFVFSEPMPLNSGNSFRIINMLRNDNFYLSQY